MRIVQSAKKGKATAKDGEEEDHERKGPRPLRLELFVREDGTVDWDGAMESGRELAVFGQEVWDRLNGRGEDEGTEGASKTVPDFLMDDQPSIIVLNAKAAQLELELAEATRVCEQQRNKMWAMRTDGEPVRYSVLGGGDG